MIERVVRKGQLQDLSEIKENLLFWLSKAPEERITAVERLRRERDGNANRLQELLVLFNAHEVRYLIIGAYALAFHGAPRYTGDLDILVRADRENGGRILRALGEFGFDSLDLTIDDFAVPDRVVQLGVPPVRVDIATSITGVSWEEAEADCAAGRFGTIPVCFIGKDTFIRNKRALGRKKDLADAEALGET